VRAAWVRQSVSIDSSHTHTHTPCRTENDPVDGLGADQLFLVIAMRDCGRDLEKASIKSFDQARSLLAQVGGLQLACACVRTGVCMRVCATAGVAWRRPAHHEFDQPAGAGGGTAACVREHTCACGCGCGCARGCGCGCGCWCRRG